MWGCWIVGCGVEAYPDSGCVGIAFTFDVEAGEGVDDELFECVHVVMDAEVEAFEIEDGVGDELSRAVVGDVTAAVGLFELYSEFIEVLG